MFVVRLGRHIRRFYKVKKSSFVFHSCLKATVAYEACAAHQRLDVAIEVIEKHRYLYI